MNNPTLSLVIPALNESKIIMNHVREIQIWMVDNMPDISYEIIIINDGSTDGMGKVLEIESAKNFNLRIICHSVNMGRGRAVRTGMENSQSDYLVALPTCHMVPIILKRC
ncbi:MAG: hypothetical protein C0582_01625 [Alphaproteobacteria bacterium]|nr:MAG: hypothetical protein C0582_01625 [Alphaproteobacteria bacterium]